MVGLIIEMPPLDSLLYSVVYTQWAVLAVLVGPQFIVTLSSVKVEHISSFIT